MIKIKYSDCFRVPQRITQRIYTFWFGLHVSGMKFSRLWFPDGSIADDCSEDPGPHIFLRWAGMKTVCEYSPGRENWVTLFSCEELETGDNGRKLFLNWNGQRFELPLNIPLSASMLPVYRNRFQEMSRKHSSGLPKNIFHAEMILLNLLETVVDAAELPKTASPAEKLKKLIDDDKIFKYNISELSEMCGFSKDYLRNLFRQTYHISPKEYQKNKRLNAIIELITLTDTPLKEIAHGSGLKNVTHLNSLIKQKYGLSPRQLRSLQIV